MMEPKYCSKCGQRNGGPDWFGIAYVAVGIVMGAAIYHAWLVDRLGPVLSLLIK